MWCWHKNRCVDQWNRIESPQINIWSYILYVANISSIRVLRTHNEDRIVSSINDVGRTSLVLWLRLHTSNAGDAGLIPGWETRIPFATWCGQKKMKNGIRNTGHPCAEEWNQTFTSHYTLLMEKAMAPHSSTLAWKIPWTEEPGRLQSMGSLGVGHDWATSLSLFTFMHWRRKWQPTPVFLPGESQGRGSLVGCFLWGRTESNTTEVT